MLRPDTLALTALLALRSDVGRPLPAVAAGDRPCVRRLRAAGTADLVGLSVLLRRRPDRVRADFRSRRAQAGAARRALALSRGVPGLRFCRLDRDAGCAALPAGARRRRRAGGGAGHRARPLSGVRAGRELARMGSITALAPVLAPSLGGVLQASFGWRASFLAMAAFGLGAIVLVARLLPETMKQPAKAPISLASIVGGYGRFLRHRNYRIYLAIVAV